MNHQEMCGIMLEMSKTLQEIRDSLKPSSSASGELGIETNRTEPVVTNVNTASASWPSGTGISNVMPMSTYTSAPSSTAMYTNNLFGSIPNSFVNPPPGFLPRTSTVPTNAQMSYMSQSNIIEPGSMPYATEPSQRAPIMETTPGESREEDYEFQDTRVLDKTKPTCMFFEDFLREQDRIMSDRSMQTRVLQEQSEKIRTQIMVKNRKLAPFKGEEDHRTFMEFMKEFTNFVQPLTSNLADRAQLLRDMIDAQCCPELQHTPRDWSFHDVSRFLYDIFWTPPIQLDEYLKFNLAKWPETKGQSASQFCTKWINKLSHCYLATDVEIVITVLCGKLDSELTRGITGSKRRNYVNFLKEIRKAESVNNTTVRINDAYADTKTSKARANPPDKADHVKKKKLFRLASSSTSPEGRGNEE